jgi:hypothetical protein
MRGDWSVSFYGGVRYVTLDYRRWELAPNAIGTRVIADASEWLEPPWRYHNCDSVDLGVELTTTGNRVFSITWDALGCHESIGLREQPLLGFRFDEDRDVAIWDVSERSRWQPHLTREVIQNVDLHYLPWGDEGFWCPRITLGFDIGSIELLLGEGRADQGVDPSADNVAVLFAPESLPEWEQTSHTK